MQTNLQQFAKEIIHADFTLDRPFVQGKYYSFRTTPRQYRDMGKVGQFFERLWYWFQLAVFGLFLLGLTLLPSSNQKLEPLVIVGAILLGFISLYRVLVVQAFLRWMYKHRQPTKS